MQTEAKAGWIRTQTNPDIANCRVYASSWLAWGYSRGLQRDVGVAVRGL